MTELTSTSTAPGVAPIKKEFLITKQPQLNNEDNTFKEESNDDSLSETTSASTSSKKRQRGQIEGRNKMNRKAAANEATTNNTLSAYCPSLARSEPCTWADQCKFNHDQLAFMEEIHKQDESSPSIAFFKDEKCPNISVHGACRFGLFCQLRASHPSTDVAIPTPPMQSPADAKIAATLDLVRKHQIDYSNSPLLTNDVREVDFRDQLYLAPLTTVGNLPFRRICKDFGADVTCSEMSMGMNLLKGQRSEWALLRRHESESVFGVQVCGGWADSLGKCATILNNHVDCDFVDLNMGCPIDLVFRKGMGSGLMDKSNRVRQILTEMKSKLPSKPLTVKIRIGVDDGKPLAGKLAPVFADCGVAAITLHGRTRQQRYTKAADWNYIASFVDQVREAESAKCDTLGADSAKYISIIGNGDVLSFEDFNKCKELSKVDSVMIARGALIKPWIFTEIKEQRHWDIRSSERLEILKKYANYGLEYFGSDVTGVDKTRRFMLEWISFLCRYVPIGLLERLPPKINDRPPAYIGRDDLETLMASNRVQDWIRLTELLLGPVTDNFVFHPKHKSNSYEGEDNMNG